MSEEYDLKRSVEGLGILVPIIKNKRTGHLIDGKHRKDFPNVPVHEVDLPEELEPLARLAINNVRKKGDEDVEEWKEVLRQIKNMKAQEIADLTGLHVSTVYRHMPQDLKAPISEAISQGRQEQVARATSVVRDTIPALFFCEICHLPRPSEKKVLFGKDNHEVCEDCRNRYDDDALGIRFQNVKREKEGKVPKVEQRAKALDNWTYRSEHMKVPHSKMELKIVDLLRKKGYKVTTGVKIVVKEIWTEPDFNIELPSAKVVHGYIDGAVHNGKQRDKDTALRDLLRMKEPGSVIEVDVKGDSDKEAEAKLAEIEEAMLF